MGRPGQIVFGLIVLTACMTTAVGLIAATSEFFNRLLPSFSYRAWMILFTLISFVLASAGLSSVLTIAVPIITFLYPIAITVVFITIMTHPFRLATPATWAFRLGTWMAAAWSAATTLAQVGVATNHINSALTWSPLQANQLGWILPTVVAALIGACIDLVAMKRAAS